ERLMGSQAPFFDRRTSASRRSGTAWTAGTCARSDAGEPRTRAHRRRGMELVLILIILAFGAVRFIQHGDDDVPSSTSEGAEPDTEPPERGGGVDYSFNPATGLPMWHEGPGGLDIEGNMWGFDDETL